MRAEVKQMTTQQVQIESDTSRLAKYLRGKGFTVASTNRKVDRNSAFYDKKVQVNVSLKDENAGIIRVDWDLPNDDFTKLRDAILTSGYFVKSKNESESIFVKVSQ